MVRERLGYLCEQRNADQHDASKQTGSNRRLAKDSKKRPLIHRNYIGALLLSPTVDGRNPASVDMGNIPLFTGFNTCQVLHDFFPSTVS